MKNVVIVQHRLLHYRVELFECIKTNLAANGVKLHLVHGGASPSESKRKDEASISWAEKIKNSFFRVAGVDIIWQSLPPVVNTCDLLILMQENRIISNYHHILKRNLSGKKIGYWGHGKNLQSTKPDGLKEKWKKKWLLSVDWWFAYTRSTKEYLVDQSFSEDRITCLNNAIDVNGFKDQLSSVKDVELAKLRSQLDIPNGAPVGLFCGSLYAEKRLDLMLNAADEIRTQITDFHVVVVGDGPDAGFLHQAAKSRPWLSLVGVKKGAEKALYYKLSSVVLNPGLVGLHVLDSFCAGLPMVTTVDALHSPEYDYLIDGVNGLVTEGASSSYAKSIVKLLADDNAYEQMRSNSLRDSEKYTVEAMADNFCRGIISCLSKKAL